jgi:hypothetical protein
MSHPEEHVSRPEEHDEVHSLLREARTEWEPDRTRMINRVAAGRSADARRRSRARTLRPVAAAASVVVISVLSVVAVRSANSSAGTHDVPPAAQAPLTPAGSPSSSPSSSPPAKVTTRPHTSAPAEVHSQAPPAGPRTVTAKSGIGKDSVATWSECTVTVTNPATVDALTVSIKVALTAGAVEAGKYTTVANSDVTMTVTKDAQALTYTWVLNENARLIPGSYVFAAQFTHTAGRTWSKDGYQVRAGATALSGGFS